MTSSTTESELEQWKAEHWSIVGPSWLGYSSIRHLLIFGDSYSQTNAWATQPAPTEQEPLGVPFPGLTSTEGPGNWVSHLVRDHQPPLLVHNYARNGQTVNGVKNQVTRQFLGSDAPAFLWKPEGSLFVSWIGINDLAFTNDPKPCINTLFESIEKLYDNQARNFLFIDVPPVDRSPAYRASSIPKQSKVLKFPGWNLELERRIKQFAAEKESAGDPITAIYYSSYKVFGAILDEPESYGLENDQKKRGGTIWVDHLHPTSAIHSIVATELDSFLSSILPTKAVAPEV